MSVEKATARAWTDADYKENLLGDPHTALVAAGVHLPVGVTVKILENTADVHYLVLPVAPDEAGQMSAEQLEQVAGGKKIIGVDLGG